MIDKVDVLKNYQCRYLCGSPGEQSGWLFCVVPYHHKLVIKLREYRFNPFAESLVRPGQRAPFLLVRPTGRLKFDIGDLKKVLLHPCAQIPFVTKCRAVVILPLDVFKEMEIVHIGSGHVIGVYLAAYATDSVELIAIIVHALGSAVAPCWSLCGIIPPHGTAPASGVLAHLYGLGVYTEHILPSVHGGGNVAAAMSRRISSPSFIVSLRRWLCWRRVTRF